MVTISAIILGLLCGLSGGQQGVAPPCQDIDTHHCESFHHAKHNLCTDPTYADVLCKRYCGNCPRLCYSCASPVRHPSACTNVTECDANMICVTKHLRTEGAPDEFLMRCENKETCGLLTDGFGKRHMVMAKGPDGRERPEREVVFNCCDQDLCNVEILPTTTTTTTTTTTPKPTTPRPTTTPKPTTTTQGLLTCYKDIVFVLDSSGSIGSANFTLTLDFVRNVISKMRIGSTHALVAMLTFESRNHIQWYLNSYPTTSQVLSALGRVKYTSGQTETAKALAEVRHTFLTTQHGERPAAHNVVVVITDGQSRNSTLTRSEARRLHTSSTDVIAIGVGAGAHTSELRSIGSDYRHVFEIHGYSNLLSLATSVLNKICS